MSIETKKVLSLVALIVATGVAAVELTRTPAQADTILASYADARVANAFDVVASMPPSEFPVAEKGDRLPIGCAGPMKADVRAECIDTAYELEALPSMVVETRTADGSILMRMDGYTLAGVDALPRSQ